MDVNGTVFVAETNSHRIRKISSAGSLILHYSCGIGLILTVRGLLPLILIAWSTKVW